MSIQPPRIEARVSSLERLQTMSNARIEELSQDMLSSFGAQSLYQGRIEQKIDALSEKIDKIEIEMSTVKAEIGTIKGDIGTMKTEVGTIKGDMAAMEGRILNAFQQLVTIIDTRLPSQEK
jgi:hypothetical protein